MKLNGFQNKCNFEKLNCLLHEKLNATTLSLEAMILFSNNKFMNWLTSKLPEKVKHLLQAARKVAPEFRRLFKERKQNILEACIRALFKKQHARIGGCTYKVTRANDFTCYVNSCNFMINVILSQIFTKGSILSVDHLGVCHIVK